MHQRQHRKVLILQKHKMVHLQRLLKRAVQDDRRKIVWQQKEF